MKTHMTIGSDGSSLITVLTDTGDVHGVTEDHPNFAAIAKNIVEGNEFSEWEDLLDRNPLPSKLKAIDDRFEVKEDAITFEGDVVPEPVVNTMHRYNREGRDQKNIALFLERLKRNPSKHARDSLFEWTQTRNLTIDEQGYMIGWKGISPTFHSISRGQGYITGILEEDGEFVERFPVGSDEDKQPLPNFPGNIVEMDRYDIDDDNRVQCSDGLHVGDYAYASSFGSILTEVRVDPKDVVTVPGSQDQKMRCCRYEVIKVHVPEPEPEYEYDEPDLDEYEPEATTTPAACADSVEESLVDAVPQGILKGFIAKMRQRKHY